MKAVLLIGGQGTRLRPFSCGTPKPLLPVVNRPFIEHQLALLRRQGVREAILCTAYRPQDFRRMFAGGCYRDLRIRLVHESSPRGTGGAVRNALPFADDTMLILNGDVFSNLDIRDFLRAHRRAKAEASIALTRVKDPTLYGLVETDERGIVKRFLEKPSWDEITCNTINAGAYLFEPAVLELIPPGVHFSLERGLFPALLQGGRKLLGYLQRGYWIDIGTVEKYLQVHLDMLGAVADFVPEGYLWRKGFLLGRGAKLDPEAEHDGAGRVLLGEGSVVAASVSFFGSVSLGRHCRIGRGASLEDCVVLDGTLIGPGARLKRCVIGHRCRIGSNAVINPGRALGDGCVLAPFSLL